MSALRRITRRYGVASNPLRTERRAELFAVALCCFVLLQLVWGALQLWQLSPPASMPPSSDTLAVRESLAVVALNEEQAEAILRRPLFWPERRPAGQGDREVPSEEDNEGTSIEGLRLVGVYGAGNSAGIIVLFNDNKLRVGVGQTVAGWRVKSVEPDAAVLTSKKGKQRLPLQTASASSKASAGRQKNRAR